ncbi:MAG: glycosyltransferase family 1 protein [Archangiaceae bacterium]|nr:glycosyltransferase family 1 protein [Archangiaceae bacterium]
MTTRHFMFAMWEGGGNVPPLLGVARTLLARGHTVTVLGDPTIEAEAQRAGCGFRPWRTAPHRTSLRPEDDLLRDWETKNPLEGLRNYRDKFIAGPAGRYAADTLEAIDAVLPDVMVSEYTIFGACMAAERRALPAVGLVPNIWPLPAAGAPPFGPGFMPARSWLGRLRDTVFRRLVVRTFDQAVPLLNQTRQQLGLPPLRAFFDSLQQVESFLVLTSAAFDFTAPHVPAHVHYVGPVLDDPDWVAPWTAPWPADNRDPLVLVGFSSTFQNQGAALRNVVAALSSLPVRGLVTLGEMLPDGEVTSSGSVVVTRSAPHRELLKSASVLVTHCGHGTTLKALAAGVPMVCMPMGRDQDDTAARVVHAGAGLRLKPSASVSAIRRAVRRVLSEPSFRTAAQRLREAMAEERRHANVAAELEKVGLSSRRAIGVASPEAMPATST